MLYGCFRSIADSVQQVPLTDASIVVAPRFCSLSRKQNNNARRMLAVAGFGFQNPRFDELLDCPAASIGCCVPISIRHRARREFLRETLLERD